MRYTCLIVALIGVAFLFASMELGEEPAGETCHEHGHCASIAFCGASCCKLLIEHDTLTAPPYFSASSLHSTEQIFYRTLIVRSIKHPPKTLA